MLSAPARSSQPRPGSRGEIGASRTVRLPPGPPPGPPGPPGPPPGGAGFDGGGAADAGPAAPAPTARPAMATTPPVSRLRRVAAGRARWGILSRGASGSVIVDIPPLVFVVLRSTLAHRGGAVKA
ncbi:hypothetical protein B5P24_04570 [Clavibacter tessellarius]|uniref:Uncharacterized protein n=1 Tax=Clavibacter tessellarius TaxID=31965 RepID=A0A225CC83_9MICO|nr:hypothetical protein B5P24_04570 [Clavibacter michiganensis subsp. tessellarius]